MNEFDYIIGKELPTAELMVLQEDYHIRVMKENGEKYIGGADFDLKRINVAIVGNTIAQILSIG